MDENVLLLGVGDTHGGFAPLFEAARREPRARTILQVGDLTAGKAGREQHADDDPATLASLPILLVWVHGNHEHWDVLGEPPGMHLWPGDEYQVPDTDVRIVGLPGNYAPSYYQQQKPFAGDRVRHFNADDVAQVSRFRHPSVLLMHEAFRGQARGRIGYMGVTVLADLVRTVQPAVCLTGHHHELAVAQHGPTLAIALPRAQEGYARLWFTRDGAFREWEFVHLPSSPGETGP